MVVINLLPVYRRNIEIQQQKQQQQQQQQLTPKNNLNYLRAIILTKRQKIVERRETLIKNNQTKSSAKYERNVTIKTTLHTKTIAKLTM